MQNTAYFSSGLFIHDDLADRARRIAEETCEGWKKAQRVEAYAITWPTSSVKTDDGGTVDQAVMCRLPTDFTEEQRFVVLKKMVERTKAYGLVVVLPRPTSIHVLFETHHGARAWVMRLERHGDVTVCLPPDVQDNAECAGLLWKPARSN